MTQLSVLSRLHVHGLGELASVLNRSMILRQARRVGYSFAGGMLSGLRCRVKDQVLARATQQQIALASLAMTVASVDLDMALTDLKALKNIEEDSAFKAQRSML